MKKILLILFSVLLLSGCEEKSKSIVTDVQESSQMDSMFELHKLDKYYSILVEKESRVCYLEYKEQYGYSGFYGITVMLNPDGTPKLWEE